MVDTSQPILVVDDFRTMARVIAGVVRKLGFSDVVTAHGGAEALKEMKRRTYAAVICDIEMVPMSGIEFIEIMRANPTFALIPVLLTTAYKARFLEFERQAPADACICIMKPFSPELLKEKLLLVLRNHAPSSDQI